jgi:hypothetical protein
MKLEVKRLTYSDKSTIGKLFLDGEFFCHTLEDVIRPEKVYGETAIPEGTYKVKITYSPRFKRDLPLLLNVPKFEGIRIHAGNTAKDTEGCILVGDLAGQDIVWQSRAAFNRLFDKLKAAQSAGEEITIEVTS